MRTLVRRALWGALSVGGVVLSGCDNDPTPVPTNARQIDLGAFVTPPSLAPEAVAVPRADFEPPSTATTTETARTDGGTVTETTRTESALDPATQTRQTRVTERTEAQDLRVGQRWPVESLVGQINGRPIYADDFFRPLEDRIRILAAMPNQQQARALLRQLVSERFGALIDSELIMAEAQSRLTPEMQQGLFAWLRDMQEDAIARSGGSRSNAEEQLREETGMGVEEFIESRKTRALSEDLLRRKVEPRVIVSWRDVQRLYEINRAQFAPDPLYRLGLMRLAKRGQEAQIEEARRLFESGKSFSEVAKALNLANDGAWRTVRVTSDGMDIGDLTDDLANALRPLKPGEHSKEVDQRNHVVWVAVLGEERPPSLSIFDPKVQLGLYDQLENYRRGEEQMRYLRRLRSRWLSDDIQKMEFRLLTMALTRYFDASR